MTTATSQLVEGGDSYHDAVPTAADLAPGRPISGFIEAFSQLSPEKVRSASRRAHELLDAMMADSYVRLDRVLATRTAPFTGRDERGNVEVTVVPPGMLTELTIDPTWLSSVSLDRLVATVRSAFERAYDTLDAALDAVPQGTSAAREQFDRLRDPVELRRWLERED